MPVTNGFDRGGTVSPSGSIVQSGNIFSIGTFEEYPDSPEIERAEQCTVQHRLKTTWANAQTAIQSLGRGTIVHDSAGNTYRILSSKIQSEKGGLATISITSESISFDSPPDEFQIVPVELGVDIMKHPRYNWALLPWTNDTSTYTNLPIGGGGSVTISYNDVKQSVIRMIQTYRDSPYLASGDNVNSYVQSSIIQTLKNGGQQVTTTFKNPNFSTSAKEVQPDGKNNLWVSGTPLPTVNCRFFAVNVPIGGGSSDPVKIAIAAALEIISKLWRGEDTPPITGYELTWSQYYFAPVALNPGNYIESPLGIVPAYFMNTGAGNTGPNIFNQLTSINPQSFSVNGLYGGSLAFSCLRKPDEIDYQRTWFKVTRKWLCSPIGHWDSDLLTTNNRPQNAGDYHGVV
jgi:hypothetical protein